MHNLPLLVQRGWDTSIFCSIGEALRVAGQGNPNASGGYNNHRIRYFSMRLGSLVEIVIFSHALQQVSWW